MEHFEEELVRAFLRSINKIVFMVFPIVTTFNITFFLSLQDECPVFLVENGKTFISDADGGRIFGNFSLKLLGQLMSQDKLVREKHGNLVATCTSQVKGCLETK